MEVRISVTRGSLSELLQAFDLDVGDRPLVEPLSDDSGTLLAFADDDMIGRLRSAGYDIEVGANVSEIGRQRQAEVGRGDRFEGGRVVPQGRGRKIRDGEPGGTA